VKSSSDRLGAELERALHPVYLITGDEPLLAAEAADSIRRAARGKGHAQRELHVAERGFDWDALLADADTLSLFAERRIIEIRLPTGKPGDKGAKALCALANKPPHDTLLLVLSPKLDKRALSAAWVKAFDKAGCIVQVWPVETARLPSWIAQRMRSAGLVPDREATQLLAERVEGNLLAAQQEIDKLVLLRGEGPVDVDAVRESVADSSRYDVFQLADAALQGETRRALKILGGLRQEGVDAVLVSWALARELRSLESMAWEAARGARPEKVLARVWQKRKPIVAGALRRLDLATIQAMIVKVGETDQIIKGARRGRAWDELRGVVATLSGQSLGRIEAVA
jgi:DNA polymerase-3 subunit delta